MTQSAMILDYLMRNKSITQKDAIDLFGCYRLGARIWDLKNAGVEIVRHMEDGVNRFGERTRYARSSLGGKDGTEPDTTL